MQYPKQIIKKAFCEIIKIARSFFLVQKLYLGVVEIFVNPWI